MSDRDPADHALIAAIQAGDLKAFEAFYRRYESVVFRTARSLTRDQMAAEDVVVETFLRAHAARDRIDPERPPVPWLQRIAVNLALNHRRRQRHGTVRLEDSGQELEEASATPESAVEGHETARALARCLDRLPGPARAAIVLRYVHGASLAEIADVLDCPLGTVKSRLHNGLLALRADLRHELALGDPAADGALSREAEARQTP